MARLPRYSIGNQLQHIIQRGLDELDIFINNDDYVFYWACPVDAAKANHLKIHAYILMPDHVHLLASPGEEHSIPKTLQSLGRRYVQHFNANYGNSGTLWEGRYRATLVDIKDYFLNCSRYIELNGVRAGLASHPEEYDWSSYAHNALGQKDPLVSEHRMYKKLSTWVKPAHKIYRSLFNNRLSTTELEFMRNTTNKGWAMGDEKFAIKNEKPGGRRATQLPRGRPRLL